MTSRQKPKNNMDKYYVYVLQSIPTARLYVGMSSKPDERLKAHNAGKSTWTKSFRPWVRIHLEEYEEKSRAMKSKKHLKSGWGRQWLEKNVLNKITPN